MGFTRKLLGRLEPGQECLAWIDGPYGPSPVSSWGFSGESSSTDTGRVVYRRKGSRSCGSWTELITGAAHANGCRDL
ncbi:hypothetical protein M432DRAFT_612343 [Thermoascus aurantiacus ATCC 26904]